MNREQYFTDISAFLQGQDLQYIQRAYWLVKDAHRAQIRRLTGERYFEHVRRVSWAAACRWDFRDTHTIALGLLHDVIEDTYVPSHVIINLFGSQMYRDVLVLSKEVPFYNELTGEVIGRGKKPDDDYYLELSNANLAPRRIKACDRDDNCTDLATWEQARRNKYIVETTERVLPIVRATDGRIAAAIEDKLEAAK